MTALNVPLIIVSNTLEPFGQMEISRIIFYWSYRF